jgi:hypothetical protein
MARALVLILSLTAACSVLAQTPADRRLDRRVSLKLKKAPLSRVTEELSRLTGATLHADPAVADEPVVLWVTEQPARAVMDQVATLFDYRWERTGAAGSYRYRLHQNRKSAEEEERLRQADYRRAFDALRKELERELRFGPGIGAAEAERMQAERQAIRQVAGKLSPDDWRLVAAGDTLRYSSIPEHAARPLTAAEVQALLALREQFGIAGVRPEGVRVTVWMDVGASSHDVSSRLQSRIGVFTTPDSPRGSELLRLGGTVGVYRHPIPAAPDEAAEADRWRTDPVLTAPRSLELPPAPRQVRRVQRGPRVYELLPVMAETYGFNVVADAYGLQRQPPQLPGRIENAPAYAVLNGFVFPGSEWERSASWVRVRSRTWYFDRLSEPPQRLIDTWRAALVQRRSLTLDEAGLLMVQLRDSQVSPFIARMKEHGIHLGASGMATFGGNAEALRAYGLLPSRARELLQQGQSVRIGGAPPGTLAWLSRAVDRQERDRPPVTPLRALGPETTLSIRINRKRRDVVAVEDGQVRYRLLALDGPGAGTYLGSGTAVLDAAPPGYEEGGEVMQDVTFILAQPDQPVRMFTPVNLPIAYVEPRAPPPAEPEKP